MISDIEIGFTFYFSSIKVKQTILALQVEVDLHSTLVLLKKGIKYKVIARQHNLHSTLVLLKQDEQEEQPGFQKEFTFYFSSIKARRDSNEIL